jgi:hypothetical protein
MHRTPSLPSRRRRSALRSVGTIAAVATLAALSVSCGADGNSAEADPTGPTAAAVSTSSPAGSTASSTVASDDTTTASIATPDALQFSAPVVGGGTLDLASFAGTTVLFWFWAPG